MRRRNLLIFDVDGTLIDAHRVDNTAYDDAFREITGYPLTAKLWETFTEVTAVAIIHQALGSERRDLVSVEGRIRDSFLAKLKAAHLANAKCIQAFDGALEVFSTLKSLDDFKVAIATGCWRETAFFKLESAGFAMTTTAFASASNECRRAEIIRLAAKRAGGSVEHAVYIGDGEWDLRATRELGIPFIAVGRRVEELRRAGARYVLEDFSMAALTSVLDQIESDPAAL